MLDKVQERFPKLLRAVTREGKKVGSAATDLGMAMAAPVAADTPKPSEPSWMRPKS